MDVTTGPEDVAAGRILTAPPRGSRVGVLAPSSSGADLDRAGLPRAEERLAGIGLGVRYGSHLWDRGVLPALPAEQRLEDFVRHLEDPEVSVIMAVYGGYNCIDLLPLLPYDAILDARKVIVGFSDITALLLGIYAATGLPGLHGPNLATLCEPTLRPAVLESLRDALTP
ncbi:MAG TPA: LD-carboxypeptidase, partial [Longimicrobiaceae bacterium]|nr:LD-carboxypeptidase [Longimicrobiaceae bacterium]